MVQFHVESSGCPAGDPATGFGLRIWSALGASEGTPRLFCSMGGWDWIRIRVPSCMVNGKSLIAYPPKHRSTKRGEADASHCPDESLLLGEPGAKQETGRGLFLAKIANDSCHPTTETTETKRQRRMVKLWETFYGIPSTHPMSSGLFGIRVIWVCLDKSQILFGVI